MRNRQFKLRNIVIPMACLGVMAYFAHHAVHGDHGLYASWQLNDTRQKLLNKQAELRETRKSLEQKVALMRPENLDPDMLDEQARARLNLAHPDDITIFRDPNS